jgi:MFS transporter, BCD family, chlorophyll transporter
MNFKDLSFSSRPSSVSTSTLISSPSPSASRWIQVARLGVVQACMGAVVVTTTTTLNRVMVVELALPALVPGLLIGFHYLIQIVRPRLGFGADQSKRFTPWILGGMATLSIGGILAAWATVWMASSFATGLALALLAFGLIGIGVSACGTTLLVLLSKGSGEHQRATSATLVWCMMIFGFALTSIVSGRLLDPFSLDRLLQVSVGVSALTLALTAWAMWGLEERWFKGALTHPHEVLGLAKTQSTQPTQSSQSSRPTHPSEPRFKAALALLWQEPQARLFTFFVFTCMLAYSAQDLILEPFAALIYHLSPGQTTQLSGTLHASVLVGMLFLAFIASRWVNARLGSVSTWMVLGCLISALGMGGLCLAGWLGSGATLIPLTPVLGVLGFGNGVFSIAAISSMMRLATLPEKNITSSSLAHKPGLRMGLWGAAQAVAFGLGGVLGTGASDLARHWVGNASLAYASVFALESSLFIASAVMAWRVQALGHDASQTDGIKLRTEVSEPFTLNAT